MRGDKKVQFFLSVKTRMQNISGEIEVCLATEQQDRRHQKVNREQESKCLVVGSTLLETAD